MKHWMGVKEGKKWLKNFSSCIFKYSIVVVVFTRNLKFSFLN